MKLDFRFLQLILQHRALRLRVLELVDRLSKWMLELPQKLSRLGVIHSFRLEAPIEIANDFLVVGRRSIEPFLGIHFGLLQAKADLLNLVQQGCFDVFHDFNSRKFSFNLLVGLFQKCLKGLI